MQTNRPLFDSRKDYSKDIQDGPHICQITEAHTGFSKSGNPMLTLTYEVVDKDDPSKERDFQHWVVLTDSRYGFGVLSAIVNAIGVVGIAVDPQGLDPFEQDSCDEHLVGKCLVIHVTNEEAEWNGQKVWNARYHSCEPLSDETKSKWALEYPDTGVPPFGDGEFGDPDIPF